MAFAARRFAARRTAWVPALAAAALLLAPTNGRAQDAAVAVPAPPPSSVAALEAPGGVATVPVSLDDVHVFVEATVNGKPVRMVLDSGAGGNILTPEAARRLDVELDASRVKASGAATVTARRGMVKRLAVGGATLDNTVAYVIPLPPELGADGLIGYDFLARFVATLDYEKKTLTLTLAGKADAATQAGAGATALPLTLIRNLPVVEAEADGHKGLFRLDTGAGDALTLFPAYADATKVRDRYPKRIRTATGKGVGGMLYGEAMRIASFKIGGVEFRQMPVDISRPGQGAFADKDQAGNVGGQVLRRFVVTFDYPGKRVFLRPNPATKMDAPFPVNRAGVAVGLDRGRFSVVAVVPDSPATEAGIKQGDAVLAVDGVSVAQLTPSKIREAFRQDAGKTVTLEVQTGSASPRLARLTLRDLR